MTEPPRPTVLLDILETHLEELDFLWEQREGVIFAPDWNLSDLARLEERAAGHLDGLRIGADHSVRIARPRLAGEEKNAATAAALTLMAMDAPDLEREAVAALAGAPPEAREGIRIGLRHSDVSRVIQELTTLAAGGDPLVRTAAADVLAFHRLPAPPRFPELLNHGDPIARTLVYAAAGRFGGPWSVDYLQDALDDDRTGVRWTALETSARVGVPRLAEYCRGAATRPRSPCPEALEFLGIVGDAGDLSLFQSASRAPQLARAAVAGMGALGRVSAIPTLLQLMHDPALSHAAGAAFVRITGATDIEADLPSPPPPDLPEKEYDFWDESHPPDPARAEAWWGKAKGRFDQEGRWQAGQRVATGFPRGQVDGLSLKARRDVYLGARAQDPKGTPDLDLEWSAVLQLARVPGRP